MEKENKLIPLEMTIYVKDMEKVWDEYMSEHSETLNKIKSLVNSLPSMNFQIGLKPKDSSESDS